MYKGIIVTLCAIGLVTGCGDSSNSSLTKTKDVGYVGFFVDAAVSGASWSCGEASGITDSDGKFGICPPASTVTLSIGNIILGKSAPTDDFIFTTQDLAGVARDETDNVGAVRLGTLLLSMDDDGDPSNGIQITPTAVVALNQTVTEEREFLELPEEEANSIIDDAVEDNPNVTEAPTPEEVQQHLQDTNGDIADGTQEAGEVIEETIQDDSTN